MTLSTTQLTTLKAAIQADPVLNAFPNDSNGANDIARILNQPSSPNVMGWRTDAPIAEIINAIAWDKFTPASDPPAIPGSPTNADLCAQLRYLNKLMLIQTKQINLNSMVASAAMSGVLDFSKASIRLGIRDAVIALPAGAADTNVSAGGAGGVDVLTAGTRVMTKGEVILKVGQATAGTVTAQIFGFEGFLTMDDVREARSI